MRDDTIPLKELNLIRILRKVCQNDDKSDELPGIDVSFEEALENLKLEKERRKIKIKSLESEIKNDQISREQKNRLKQIKNEHDEWKNLIDNTLEDME